MDATKLTQQLTDFTGTDPTKLGEEERRALVEACAKLQASLEDPIQKFANILLSPYDAVVLRIAMDMGVVDVAVAQNGPITAQEIASKANSDAGFVRRVSRILVLIGIFAETAADTYVGTPLAPMFATGSPIKESIIHIAGMYPAVGNLPNYFQKNGYKNPSDAFNGPWQFTNKAGESYFDWLARPGNESQAHAFNVAMSLQKAQDEATWCGFYPGDERLKVEDPERVLFVDVGGSLGHEVERFHKRFPSLPGKLVVQDLPSVISAIKDLPEAIVRQPHNFFEPQTDLVKGAKAFYMRMILHDWPDAQARTILGHLRDAMADDSVVLIHENILADTNVPAFQARMDWHMMSAMSSLERTETQWKTLLEESGLEVVKIWKNELGIGKQYLIEATKKA